MFEIVVLALLAGFIALRLISVLGRHDESAETPQPMMRTKEAPRAGGNVIAMPAAERPPLTIPDGVNDTARGGLEAIAGEDAYFDPTAFVEGATAAYRMVLESFWNGDKDELKDLVSDDIYDDFAAAIDARADDDNQYENRLVDIENAEILSAGLRGQMAEITVRFDSDLISVTRDADGNVIAGSDSDATQAHDIWTFSRHLSSDDPAWLLIETDGAE
ncbi:Tim44 domain-containing protein [Pacificimonas sp. WHA3]|uniref:Tim44 domain-containing protein n=1 Tax=Pacificimonas pallii TaxID=2827236 RepID=A0ABS6SG65_9SPHN|nr:Tim44/TimA family putative adaptor protein [Pacificimonas pallii]MBV7257250.1 Tim44 domain-containing protein [Pacificimonas pallii]